MLKFLFLFFCFLFPHHFLFYFLLILLHSTNFYIPCLTTSVPLSLSLSLPLTPYLFLSPLSSLLFHHPSHSSLLQLFSPFPLFLLLLLLLFSSIPSHLSPPSSFSSSFSSSFLLLFLHLLFLLLLFLLLFFFFSSSFLLLFLHLLLLFFLLINADSKSKATVIATASIAPSVIVTSRNAIETACGWMQFMSQSLPSWRATGCLPQTSGYVIILTIFYEKCFFFVSSIFWFVTAKM